jgi:transposase-like protein
MKNAKSLKNAWQLFCLNEACPARGKIGAGNLVSHGKKRERYQCKICKKTFCAHQGTMFEGLHKPEELIVIVVTLLAYGCPSQALVARWGSQSEA